MLYRRKCDIPDLIFYHSTISLFISDPGFAPPTPGTHSGSEKPPPSGPLPSALAYSTG